MDRDASDRMPDKAIVNPMIVDVEMVTLSDDNVNGHDIAERVHDDDDDPIDSNDVRISDIVFRHNTSY